MTNIVMLFHSRYALAQQALKSMRINTDVTQYNLTMVYDLPQNPDFRLSDLLEMHAFGSNTTMLKVYNSGHVLSQLKNIGVAWSKQCFGEGEWLYLSDSDVFFTPNWLEKLIEFAAECGGNYMDLYGGQIHPYHQKDEAGDYKVLDGPSWLLKWSLWYQMWGLRRDTASGVCQSEEYPFCQALKHQGGYIHVIEPHVVAHTGLTNSDGKDAPGRAEREAKLRQLFPTVICK